MCLSCGCGQPDDPMNDDRNITREKLQAAADAAGISLQDAADNISKTLRDSA